jgi:hypothetical protein
VNPPPRTRDATTATLDPVLDGPDMDRLRDRVLDFFLTHDPDRWYTDEEIRAVVGNSIGGVGARRRDLRKPEYGEYIIVDRRRKGATRLWEYQFRGKRQPEAPVQEELRFAI